MIPTPFVIAIVYAAAMFLGAGWAHRRRDRLQRSRWRLPAYALGLSVYCTSWTYFGAVGTAVSEGWNYLPIYLGPMLLLLLGAPFLRRMVAAVHAQGATSISDFIGARFGSSRGVAALVTLLALFGTIPYIALQLRSVGMSYAIVTGTQSIAVPIMCAAAALALFAILFGTRRYEVAARNEAVLFAVAAESIIKLLALGAVAAFATWLFLHVPAPQRAYGLDQLGAHFAMETFRIDFPVVTALATMAILCLPRQFYIGVMEARDASDIVRARWPFFVYLLLTVLAVVPITLAGLTLLDGSARPDFFILALPRAFGMQGLATIVFLGGLSAAVAMVVTEAIALSTMVSNDLIAPLLLRRQSEDTNLGGILLNVRRAAILLLLAGGATYALLIPAQAQLASMGLIAFVAMAQYAPVLVIAVLRGDNDAMAAKAGLTTGLLLWLYTLFLPGIGAGILPQSLAGSLIDPRALLGVKGLSLITHGALWSLGGNLLVFAIVWSRRVRRADFHIHLSRPRGIAPIADLGALADMVERFVGPLALGDPLGPGMDRAAPVDRSSARAAERMVASVVGASSARAIMASALSGEGLGVDDITQLLDASGQSLRFSRGLLAATLENIGHGVSVIDRNLRLIAWNSRYLELFGYPAGMVRVGAPVSDLIRFNAERGECGPGGVEQHVAKRLGHMREGRQHGFERRRMDGRVIKTVGGPMPDGGYVMCFTDITAEAEALAGIELARAELERRVEERTAELSDANAKLARATAEKTRFLAAASHDLLQPLHAARLFSEALRRKLPEENRPMLGRIDRSIEAANDLLRALLDISKMDAGGVVPHPRPVAVRPLLAEVAESLEPLAAERGLSLRVGAGTGAVHADPTLLRSILQNFLSNAIRYTQRGGVLMGVRRHRGMLRIEVYDSGIGIPQDKQAAIFREFERLETAHEPGIGLGLAIVERSAALTGGRVDLVSVPGQGSRFTLILPAMMEPVPADGPAPALAASTAAGGTPGRTLLAVDDDPAIGEAMAALLAASGHHCVTCATPEDALAHRGPIDGALVDFHLGEGPRGDRMDGIALIDRLRDARPGLPVALVTADRSADMTDRARCRHIPILQKPLNPAELDRWLTGKDAVAAE
ncbi:PAS domain-containing hybrid sensor histidine kinase/response regulator [Sphingobium sp. H39-3-25]|uniref:hybrid sensor histidine kinase/response regulator n=1 Tax=Sphingobium arseniciresistens TaxID=3030834 RepID=UPI0023B8DC83|nr:PAS domain-containing hybrid sensor histidine kinase/response regulator [Sphingobium arseniciresistens]